MVRDSRSSGEGPSTRAVHGGEPAVRDDRSITPPIVHASTFPFGDTAELVAFMRGEHQRPPEYGRYGNPTIAAAEAKLAALEGGDAAVLMASGMAAITTTMFAMLRSGQHVVLTSDVYRKTRQFARQVLTRFGVDVDIVEPNAAAVQAAIREQTRLVLTESPTNPYLRLVDIEALVAVAKAARAKVVIDATFATPTNMRPLEYGVDLVIHSTTKYLAGHNDVLGGVVIGKGPIVEAIRDQLGMTGAIADPHGAYLTLRGLKTLGLRVARQNDNALRLARILSDHPRIRRVWYPLLETHPDHALAQRYLRGGGGVVSFEVDGGLEAGTRFVDALQIPKIAPSLGGVESLVEQPALMSFFELSPEERRALGIVEGLVRFSVGIEDPEDLERDLRRALEVL